MCRVLSPVFGPCAEQTFSSWEVVGTASESGLRNMKILSVVLLAIGFVAMFFGVAGIGAKVLDNQFSPFVDFGWGGSIAFILAGELILSIGGSIYSAALKKESEKYLARLDLLNKENGTEEDGAEAVLNALIAHRKTGKPTELPSSFNAETKELYKRLTNV